ncbi:MAG: SLBB domain-containing protein [Anaerolineales bacterium]|nr:SLBB domain-containing protein [Anaerolineales bacterium]
MNSIIRVGMSTCGLAAGAQAVYTALEEQIRRHRLPVTLVRTGCLGACHREPLVEVIQEGVSTLYGPVTPLAVPTLLESHSNAAARPPQLSWVVSRQHNRADYPFLGRQVKVTTRLCGLIDPHSLDDYLANDGYAALRLALKMKPEAIVKTVLDSHLRGRGGAGFPTGQKWEIGRQQPAFPKYLICNADEGDPGAFMDRTMIEGDPHRLLEGMLIAAWAIGASKGYIYIRAEYPLAVKALHEAIRQARTYGVIGRNILGSGLDFEFVVKEGAGAFVCGEETALMHSIEGYRGMPSMRPPYPSVHGLWGQPTNINNVETYASVPSILLNGPDWFARMGTAKSGGTKAVALTGAIQNSGLVETPIGMTVREMIYDIAGGCRDGRTFKAVQLGGPSGGCIPAELLDTRIDYEDLRATGPSWVQAAWSSWMTRPVWWISPATSLTFTQDESCGKCIPCRVGTRKLLHMLTAITEGRGTQDDLVRLNSLCDTIRKTSLCGLGQTAPNPVQTTMRYFADEYHAHVNQKRCVAGSCRIG